MLVLFTYLFTCRRLRSGSYLAVFLQTILFTLYDVRHNTVGSRFTRVWFTPVILKLGGARSFQGGHGYNFFFFLSVVSVTTEV